MIAGVVNKMNYIMVSSAAVKRPEDLKGKRIGAAQAGRLPIMRCCSD
jgi:hypothetical protein